MNADRFILLSLTLLPYMLKNETVGKQDLCRRFDLSERELEEFFERAMMCGIPDYTPDCLIEFLDFGEEVSVRFAEYVERPVKMKPDEVIAVMLMCKIWKSIDPELAKTAKSIETKLILSLDPDESDGFRELMSSVAIDLDLDDLEKTLKTIRLAIMRDKPVEIAYVSRGHDKTSRIIEPWALFYSAGFWYLEAFCRERQDRRTFRVDRIRSISLVDGKRQAVPLEIDAPDFADIFCASRKKYEVVIECGNELAERLGAFFCAYEKTPAEISGSRICFAVDDLVWVALELLPFIEDITIVEPADLQKTLCDQLDKIAISYS